MLTAERLKELLAYDPETGAFVRIGGNRVDLVGCRAGCVRSDGYVVIKVDGALYPASRLAWLYMTGEWPRFLIDHIDGKRGNDAFGNLRAATRCQNNANIHVARSATGFKGVFLTPGGRFAARLYHGRPIALGTFDDARAAAIAYNAAALSHFGEFASLNQV